MALETFNFIDSLVPDNPVVSDGLVNGDDHMRGIKLTLKNTFPNITGAVTATQADLNSLATGVTKLKGAGTYFDTNTTDGLRNTIAGDIDVVLQGNIAATFQLAGGVNFFKVSGSIQATGELKGPGMAPIGSAIVWHSDTLPPTDEGMWVWCNGATYNKADFPTAYMRLGGTNGTTFTVPNYQEVVLVGKSGMGGAAAPGLLASIASNLKGVLNGVFGSDTVTLTASQIPTITSNGSMTGTASGSISGSASNVILGGTAGGGGVGGGGNFGLAGSASVSGSFSGSASVSGSVSSTNTGGQAHSNVQPSRVVNWIIRLG
ncbi:microcystin-dependent protein [Bradyrhizobium sp. F1.4.3]|uniref:tail fiber protein n=1 Tax=Bradyrhizobium sp. F1.4.3 TaxID=3156356 RepID=UPI003390E4EB